MTEITVIQGRTLAHADIVWIRRLIAEHPQWHRNRLSQELCQVWDWCDTLGRPKDMAARTLLLKLHRREIIQLPEPRHGAHPRQREIVPVAHETVPITGRLREILPVSVSVVGRKTDEGRLFDHFLSRYHYLGYRHTVGENIRYLVRDRYGRPLGCLLFGSAAWKCADRDGFLGWDRATRERNLQSLTNNTRFLILPWVEVPHLASHLLGLISRRIRADWLVKYGHPVHALETFVDRSRFKGSCYRAANWLWLGATRGRTRNDHAHRIQAPVKDVYLYPLVKGFREALCHDHA